MRAEYDSGSIVRRSRLLGRTFIVLVVLGLALAMSWRILQVLEQRNLQATQESLASSLLTLSAEYVAQRKTLPVDWLQRNPFELLRWQQANYCGELEQGQRPARGCWYFLPEHAWLLYRSRFSDGASETGDDLQLFRVRGVPISVQNNAESEHELQALELEPVPQAERQAVTLWKD